MPLRHGCLSMAYRVAASARTLLRGDLLGRAMPQRFFRPQALASNPLHLTLEIRQHHYKGTPCLAPLPTQALDIPKDSKHLTGPMEADLRKQRRAVQSYATRERQHHQRGSESAALRHVRPNRRNRFSGDRAHTDTRMARMGSPRVMLLGRCRPFLVKGRHRPSQPLPLGIPRPFGDRVGRVDLCAAIRCSHSSVNVGKSCPSCCSHWRSSTASSVRSPFSALLTIP
jgi:hypothetical protein